MNNLFNEAIETHAQWQTILKRHIEEGQAQNLEEAGNCHICGLGKWIYGDGEKYNRSPSFASMASAHEQFHLIAAEVALNTNTKDIAKAKSLLATDGSFSKASVKLIKSLMNCSRELSDSLVTGIRNVRKVKNILQTKEIKDIVTIAGNAPVMDALKSMIEHNIGSLVINDIDDNLLGIITERGFLKNLYHKGLSALDASVSEMLDKDMIHVDPDDSVEQCMLLMTATHLRHLPVIENGKLIGMISIGDVVKEVVTDDVEKISQLDEYIHGDYGAKI